MQQYQIHQPDNGHVFEKTIVVSALDGHARISFVYNNGACGNVEMDLERLAHLRDIINEVLGERVQTCPKGWEPVTPLDLEDEECAGDVDRMRVPGGWIYTVCHAAGDGQSAVFVPLPK